MKSRALRFTLLALYVGLIGGAAYSVWENETEGMTTAAAARKFDEQARDASRTVLDMKATQPGYVAAGQGGEFWAQRMDALLSSARDALAALASLPHCPPAGSEIETARTVLDDFGQMDRRARDYARHSQTLLSSDLIFSDGIEKLDAAAAAVERARTAEVVATDLMLRERRRLTLAWIAGTVAACLLIALALTPVPRPMPAATQFEAPPAPIERDLPIRFEPPARTAVPPPAAAAAPDPPVAAAPAAPATPPAPASVDIEGVAALCVEFSRLSGPQALGAALQHAAALLDASGIVVWVADPDGRELAPVAAHGYPPHLVTRMGAIHRDAENVTAAAFRTGLVQTMKSDAVSPGAIAAPLLSPAGSIGVVAAEILHHRESGDDLRAIAAIVAAQISPLVAPAVPHTAGRTEAAGA